jgi:hypothetical protein
MHCRDASHTGGLCDEAFNVADDCCKLQSYMSAGARAALPKESKDLLVAAGEVSGETGDEPPKTERRSRSKKARRDVSS